jgi:hypothetical protein
MKRSTASRLAGRALAAAAVCATVLSGYPVAQATEFGTPAAEYMAGGITANGMYFAKSNSNLTLTVKTDSAARCVEVTGVPTQTGTRTTWTFTVPTAAPGTPDGVQTKTVKIGEGSNANGCSTKVSTTSVSYVLDNTGPSVTASVNPAPNAGGWNNATATVSWVADDHGGVGGGSVTGATTVSTDTAGQTVSGSATDALGSVGPTQSVVVKRDTVKPTITGSRSPAANSLGWNNSDVTVSFTCSDALSLIKSCATPQTVTGNGANQSATGAATDNADNTQSATVGGISIDKTAPTVTASATPYLAGTWTNQDVTVAFACADQLSGVNTCDGAKTLNGEGANQSASGSGSDKAGNTASATFGGVNIDKTAPSTTATAPQTAWNNSDVTVNLTATDALSGVRETRFTVNGGATQTGTSAAFSAEGSYTLAYWSVDNAGNTEATKTVTVKIDKTPPSINHTLSPAPNANGWANSDVTVTFTCGDTGGSGVASCGPNQTVGSAGKGQPVTGTAVDNAGNTATDPVTVSIDKTAPTVTPSVSSPATRTEYGWYNADVTVSYECADNPGGSGVDGCPAATTLGEGAGQSATGTALDAAGNTGSATVTGINVDKTPPVLAGTPSTTGWSTGDVTVTWTCTDAGSGVVAVPEVSTVTGEGGDLSASATCVDKAGNSISTTVSGIRIDRAAPNSSATVAQPFASGWYADSVDVTLSTVDSLSGPAATWYTVDGGAPVGYAGPFTIASGGIHVLTYWSVDNAGNVEDTAGNTLALWVDTAPPTITGGRTPAANSFGWNNTPVGVAFVCGDTQSGVAGCAEPAVLAGEGADQSVIGTAVDGVGKTATATVGGINIDLTAPTLTGEPTTDPKAGWYNGDVAVRWTGIDGLSGIDPATQPVNSVITGEGHNLSAGPVTVKDKAGNESAPATYGNVNIDRTAPVITGGPITAPNAAGWYRDEVVIDFGCADPNLADSTPGSGVASCPTSLVLKGDGKNQSVTSTPATDLAGNTSAGKVIGGINIDGTPPSTSSNNDCTKVNGWCTGSTANVVLTATDQTGLSGVKEIHYRIDGGSEQISAGATKTASVPLDGSGAGSVDYWSVDNAGNVEPANTVSLRWDNIAPAVTHTTTPAPNADDWNNASVTVHFVAKDDDAGSGVDPSSITPDVVVSDETAGRVINGSARDAAGNTGTDAVTIKLDRTAPAITGSITGGTLGSSGWYTSPVTVHFVCSDPLAANGSAGSGIPATACPDDVTLSGNGGGQSVTRTVTDRAGNTGSVTVGGISIDQERPTITSVSVQNGAIYNGTPATPTCTATDDVSGVDSCTVVVNPLATVGDYAFTATARDKAGNTATLSGRYHVNLYRFSGFLQPINDPSIQPGAPISVVKTGSTLPVKFQLRDAQGNLVQARTAPQWLTPVRGGLITASVNESTGSDPGTTDGTFRWDATAQQYIYNWQTKGAPSPNYVYKIGVRLDDGQTFFVTVGLK